MLKKWQIFVDFVLNFAFLYLIIINDQRRMLGKHENSRKEVYLGLLLLSGR